MQEVSSKHMVSGVVSFIVVVIEVKCVQHPWIQNYESQK